MTNYEKAKIILEALDEKGVNVDWNFEDNYLLGILEGLTEISKREKEEK